MTSLFIFAAIVVLAAFAALAALRLPFVIAKCYRSFTRTVFRGTVRIFLEGCLPPERAAKVDYDFLSVLWPDPKALLLELSQERLRDLKQKHGPNLVQAEIVVRKSLFGEAFIESVQWPGEPASTTVDNKMKGLGYALYFLVLVLAAMVLSAKFYPFGLLHYLCLVYAAIALIAAGFSLEVYRKLPKNYSDISIHLFNLIPLGRGANGLFRLTVVLAVAMALCVWAGGFLMVLPGINVAMGLGWLIAFTSKAQGARWVHLG